MSAKDQLSFKISKKEVSGSFGVLVEPLHIGQWSEILLKHLTFLYAILVYALICFTHSDALFNNKQN